MPILPVRSREGGFTSLCFFVKVGGNVTPNKYRENMFKTRNISIQISFWRSCLYLSNVQKFGDRAHPWYKLEENLHGALQREDKCGQFAVSLTSRLTSIFKMPSSLPTKGKGATG